MGNCLFGGLGSESDGSTKVITSNGGIMEFHAPITVDSVTAEFPGHGVFHSHDLFWKPLSPHEDLLPGKSYYLLPLKASNSSSCTQIVRHGHIRSNSIPTMSAAPAPAPYRMSLDYQGMLKRSYTEVFSRYGGSKSGGRVWKVKLVICPEQLLEILSQEGRTQELIESVRTVAKCGNGSVAASVGFSDQWSLSSRNGSIKTDGLVDI